MMNATSNPWGGLEENEMNAATVEEFKGFME
jgi:hypothetical protein